MQTLKRVNEYAWFFFSPLFEAKCCENLMAVAKEARKGTLSSMHPSFNLLKLTRQLMVRELPDNAHLLASGKLCVSLTRLSDGKNVLVSEFSSKDDLIQVNLSVF